LWLRVVGQEALLTAVAVALVVIEQEQVIL
jgi:hypothetical protein